MIMELLKEREVLRDKAAFRLVMCWVWFVCWAMLAASFLLDKADARNAARAHAPAKEITK